MPRRGPLSRAALYDRLEVEMHELRTRLGGLPRPEEAEGIWRHIWIHEAHNSTAIEGNTLALREVAILLEEQRPVGGKELREYLEVQGYADAAAWVYAHALDPDRESPSLLTMQEVRHVHHQTLGLVWSVAPHPQADEREAPGNFRLHNIAPFGSGMQPPDFTLVPSLLHDWVDRVNRVSDADRARIWDELARTHVEFERIHPFLDGNGRAGRLLLNLILVRLGYPPAIIEKRQRARYLSALRLADAGNTGELAEMIARAVLDNLHQFIYRAVAGRSRLVPLEALQSEAASYTALRLAARRGRLRVATGPDGIVRSSQEWVDEYLETRHRRLNT